MSASGSVTPYNLRLRTAPGVSPPTTDSVLLASFPALKRGERICDLGAGNGLLSVLLASREDSAAVDAVEISEEAAFVLGEDIARYGFEGRISPVRADYRALKGILPDGGHTLVAANPPYFPRGSGKRRTGGLAAARMEENGTVFDLTRAASRLLKTGGRICLVFPSERIADLFSAMRGSGLEPKRLRLVQHTAGSPPKLVLTEGRKGGRPGLKVEAPLVLSDERGYTEEYNRIYGRET